ASYTYDSWGNPLGNSETVPNANGWSNPYRYGGRDGARSDAATGLYWLSVRADYLTIDRFLSRDPLGRAPLFFADNPYVYAGNNPLSNFHLTALALLPWRRNSVHRHNGVR